MRALSRNRRVHLTAGLLAVLAVTGIAQQPVRDRPRLPASGTATISGVVLSADVPSRPLRRARVTLASPDHPYGATAITDDDGTFVFEQLAAGRYTVGASKAAYLSMNCGAARPGRAGEVIEIRSGDVRACTMRLARGGVISGTVVDADGQPAGGIIIDVLAHRYLGGRRRLTAIGTAVSPTNDRGEYRIFGLAPGEYFVTARPLTQAGDLIELSDREIRRAISEVRDPRAPSRPGWSLPPPSRTGSAEPRRPVRYAPVFYPGTTLAARARPIRIDIAEERHGIDIQLERVPSASIEGTVTGPEGPSRFTMVTLSRRASDDAAAGLPFEMVQTAGANASGAFSFRSLPPGEYTIQAQAMTAASGPVRPEGSASANWASTDVILDGDDITGVSLVLQPPLAISGQVVFEGGAPPASLPPLQRSFPLELHERRLPSALPQLRLEPDGRFRLSGIVPGLYVFGGTEGLRTPLAGWWLKSIVMNGRNLLDRPLELRQGGDDAVVTFTNQVSELSGMLRAPTGAAPAESYVIVFPVDRASWFFYSPRVAAARVVPGRPYRVTNLPAGDYLVAATSDVDPGEWWDPELLERLVPLATRVTLGEAARVTRDVELRPFTRAR